MSQNQPFEQLILSIDAEIQASTIPPPESTPYLPPEIWSRIFVMAFGNMRQLSRISRLCKSVYLYCWLSPAAKANFYFECYGKRQAIFMTFATKCSTMPQFREILEIMFQNGARYSCLDRAQVCPILQLSRKLNAVEYIKLFYTCNPHISEDHMRSSLLNAGKNGRLDLLCALLQIDPTTLTPTILALKLSKKNVVFDLQRLILDQHMELVQLLVLGHGASYSAANVAFAIKRNYLSLAKEMISTHLGGEFTQLTEDESNLVWNALGVSDASHIEVALAIGVIPTTTSLLESAGVNINPYERVIVLNDWNHLRYSPVKPDSDVRYYLNDIFIKAGCLIDQVTIVNAASTGSKGYLEYLLSKWTDQENYLEANVIGTHAIHNAFMWRNWELVEVLLMACRQWAESSGNVLDEVNFAVLGDGFPPIGSGYPMAFDDAYFFEKLPVLVRLGIYSNEVYSSALEEVALHFYDKDKRQETITCIDKLLSMGAQVTSKSLYTSSYDGWERGRATVRFRYLLDKYEVDRQIGPDYFPHIIREGSLRNDFPEAVLLMLEKGVPITNDVLGAFYRTYFDWAAPVPEVVNFLFRMVKRRNPLRETFIGWLETRSEFDLHEYEVEFTTFYFEEIKKHGFRTSQEVVDRAEQSGKPILAGLLRTVLAE